MPPSRTERIWYNLSFSVEECFSKDLRVGLDVVEFGIGHVARDASGWVSTHKSSCPQSDSPFYVTNTIEGKVNTLRSCNCLMEGTAKMSLDASSCYACCIPLAVSVCPCLVGQPLEVWVVAECDVLYL